MTGIMHLAETHNLMARTRVKQSLIVLPIALLLINYVFYQKIDLNHQQYSAEISSTVASSTSRLVTTIKHFFTTAAKLTTSKTRTTTTSATTTTTTTTTPKKLKEKLEATFTHRRKVMELGCHYIDTVARLTNHEKFNFDDLMDFHRKLYNLEMTPKKTQKCRARRQNMTSVRRVDGPYYIYGVDEK